MCFGFLFNCDQDRIITSPVCFGNTAGKGVSRMHRQLLPHQSDAVNSIMNAINSQNISSMVISMPVGTGSTIVALEVFHRLYCNDKNKRARDLSRVNFSFQ